MSLLPGRTALARMLFPLALLVSAAPLHATLYEDGGGGANWQVRDAKPAGASVASVADEIFGEDVVETSGDGRLNAYLLGGFTAASGWNNTDERFASFRLRTSERFTVYFRVDTADGWRWLVYNHSNRDSLGGATSRSIHHGLGSRVLDDRWRVFGRDLAADLADAQPDNELLAVQGFLVRGDVRIDDVALGDTLVPTRVLPPISPDVDLDAEDGDASPWAVFDARPAGASIAVVPGDTRDGSVYALSGAGRSNGFRVGGLDEVDGWNNVEQTVLTWSMRSAGSYRVAVRIDTGDGPRYLNYDSLNGDALGHSNGRDIGFGLGRATRDDVWRDYGRDLAADLARAEPDNRIVAVQGVYVRGALRIDDIRLVDELPPPPDTSAPVAVLAAMPETGDAPLAVTLDPMGSGDDTGVTSVTWDFGDGTEPLVGDTLAPVPHVYAAGTWTATLTLSDVAGNVASAAVEIVATEPAAVDDTPPVVALAATPAAGDAPLAVTLDPAGSGDDTGVTSVSWDFGDGTEPLVGDTLEPVSHVYAAGAWTATLTLSDAAGNTASGTVDVVAVEPGPVDDTPPVAAFESVASGEGGLVVAFDASASSDDTGVVAWSWDFGDGSDAASGAEVEHTYAERGTRTVTLTVADAAGLTATLSREIDVGDDDPGDAPVAVAAVDMTDGTAPLAVTFDGSGSTASDTAGDAAPSFVWSFDDGTAPLDGVVVTRTLETPGLLVATLTVTDGIGRSASASLTVTVADGGGGTGPVTEAERDAARLLAQATFGATEADIARVVELGAAGWIDDQLGREGSPHLDYVRANSNGSSREARHDIWWRDAIEGDDQLRQRVAFALSQIFVVSDTGYTLGNAQYGITGYYDVLRSGAFGSYRALLEDVTLHPVMGLYLSMLQNDKGDPFGNTRADENFAREVLQLFSIGPHALNADGTTRMNGQSPVPSFDQDHVESYARAFTGWNFASATRWDFPVLRTDADKVRPMTPDEDHHDTDPKALLGGVTTPAGASAREDLGLALDSIANHPNVGPFIVGQLIRRLVTSNPTPAYVRRVAGVFDDDGQGARGNLGAVVRAILLDPEAREGHETVTDFGKLREPVLRISHLWRAFGARPGAQSVNGNFNTKSPHAKDLDTLIGQAVLKSPSVFNFYRPDHAPLGEIRDAGRVAPEAELYTDGHILATTTRVNSHVQLHHDLADANSLKSTFVDLSTERALLASDGADALLERLDLLLLSGGMDEGLRVILRDHVQAFPETDDGRSRAVRDAISLIMASPAYLVQL